MSDYGIIVDDVNLLSNNVVSLVDIVRLEDGKSYSKVLPTGAYITVVETLTFDSLRKFSGLTREENWNYHEITINNNVLQINWVYKNRNSPLKPIIVNIWR